MNIPNLYSIRELKKRARKKDIHWMKKRGKGGHGVFQGPDIEGKIRSYPLPSAQHKKEVTGTYLKGFLRRFGLSESFLFD
jgi:hypothetical protein